MHSIKKMFGKHTAVITNGNRSVSKGHLKAILLLSQLYVSVGNELHVSILCLFQHCDQILLQISAVNLMLAFHCLNHVILSNTTQPTSIISWSQFVLFRSDGLNIITTLTISKC